MAVIETDQFSLSSASFDPGGEGSALNLTQLQGRDFDNGLRLEEFIVPGSLDRAITVLMEGNVMVGMRTHDLLTALQGGISPLTAYYAMDGATFRYQKRAKNTVTGEGTYGGFVVADEHRLRTSTRGLIIPQSIAVSQGQLATLTMAYLALWSNRSVLPLVDAVDQALAAPPAYNSLYTLGPCKLGSDFIDGLIGWEYQTGLRIEPVFRDGLTFPVECHLIERKPSIKLRFNTPDIAAQVGNLFHGALGSALKVFARRKSGTTGDGNVLDASSAHVSHTVAAGSWRVDPAGANGQDSVPGEVTVIPTGTVATSYAAAIA